MVLIAQRGVESSLQHPRAAAATISSLSASVKVRSVSCITTRKQRFSAVFEPVAAIDVEHVAASRLRASSADHAALDEDRLLHCLHPQQRPDRGAARQVAKRPAPTGMRRARERREIELEDDGRCGQFVVLHESRMQLAEPARPRDRRRARARCAPDAARACRQRGRDRAAVRRALRHRPSRRRNRTARVLRPTAPAARPEGEARRCAAAARGPVAARTRVRLRTGARAAALRVEVVCSTSTRPGNSVVRMTQVAGDRVQHGDRPRVAGSSARSASPDHEAEGDDLLLVARGEAPPSSAHATRRLRRAQHRCRARRGVAGIASKPWMRATSSIRSSSIAMSKRYEGGVTTKSSPLRSNGRPQAA